MKKNKTLDLREIIKSNKIILAPMDNITDLAYRELCEEYGAGYTTSELISVEALIRDKVPFSRFKKGKLKINCVQLFGSNPESFKIAANKLEGIVDIIDVNFGCPSPSVNANNSGAILLNDPKNVGKIIKTLVNNTKIPITAKIRLGYKNKTYLEVAKEIENAGASLITVHGRTAEQKYSGKANWEAIKEIHDNLSIPVIGNGDICTEKDIDKYLEKYCDGLMIGRCAIGNPLIFKKFNYYLKNKKELRIENIKAEKKKAFLKYIEKLKIVEQPKLNLKIQRQAFWFMKGINGVKELRKKLMQEKNIEKILKLVDEF